MEGSKRRVLSNERGRFLLLAVPPGPGILRAEMLGYATRRVAVTVPTAGTLVQDIEMAHEALEVEGLIVTADPASRAQGELGTASVIESDAIRSQTATSLGGLLELIPGMELSPPSLGGVQQISLRALPTSGSAGGSGVPSSTQLASFGTLIVLDGVPLSNNANLQTLGSRGELSFSTSAGGGVDLRRIPASAIERIEVIRGVPSARYGDLTQGTIVVDTRAGVRDPEIGAQFDARTSEISLVWGGAPATANIVSLTVNAARSRTEPGVTDDEQTRLASQLAHRVEWGSRVLDSRVDVFALRDDRPENANVRVGRASWSRDRGIRISERLTLPWGGGPLRVSVVASYSRVDQSSWATAQRVREGIPITDRLTEGRSVGHFLQGRYDAALTLDGSPQLLYTRIEGETEAAAFGGSHVLRTGLEFRREWTSGAGYQFDLAFPPQIDFNGVQGFDRPRPFDAIAPLVTSSVYVDDRVTAELGPQSFLNLQVGLRADVLHEGSWWSPTIRDWVLQPRLSVELSPHPQLRIRGGWGLIAKVPNIGALYPAPQYHDVVNVNYFATDPAERLAVLTTSVLETENDELGYTRGSKAELGLDGGWGGASVSVVAFRDRIRGGIGTRLRPTHLVRYRYQLTDSILGNGIPPDIIDPPSHGDTVPVFVHTPDNHVQQSSTGLELSAFLPEIRWLRSQVQVQGAWVRTRQWSDALVLGNPSEVERFQLHEEVVRTPYWRGFDERSSRAILTYRLIHRQPELGMVVTITAQHNLWDEIRDVGGTDSLSYDGYITNSGAVVPVPVEDRDLPEYADLRRSRSGLLVQPRRAPADLLMGLQVSKTLPLGGRLSFWAYNAFDDVGTGFAPNVQRRLYASARFGVELAVRPMVFFRP